MIKIEKDRIRKGRGASSRRGRRSGRGNKGTGARNSGFTRRITQGGGQNPFRVMHGKIGFKSRVNLRSNKIVKLVDYSILRPAIHITWELLRSKMELKSYVKRVKILNSKGVKLTSEEGIQLIRDSI